MESQHDDDDGLGYGRLYTVVETARLLGCARSSVYRWTTGADAGTLGYFRFGRKDGADIRIAAEHIRAFLGAHGDALDRERVELNASGYEE